MPPKIDLQIRHPHSTLICLGANLGDRRHILQQALERISFVASIHKISDVYETYSRFEQFHAPYLNCCVEVSTDMTSSQLLLFLIETQRQLSADQVVADPRSSIDLDLIAYDQDIIRTPQLTLPHPESHRRAYVMIPLAQIQPHWTHPILKKTAEELARTSHWDGWGTFFMQGKRLLDF